MERGKDFSAYSLAVDESVDVTDTAQLSIFIRGVDSSLCITGELLGIKSMHGTTTGKDIFEEVSKCANEMKLPWDKLTGLTTDGAPAMREKMQREKCAGEHLKGVGVSGTFPPSMGATDLLICCQMLACFCNS